MMLAILTSAKGADAMEIDLGHCERHACNSDMNQEPRMQMKCKSANVERMGFGTGKKHEKTWRGPIP
jgi:hypothetical protein